MVDYLSTNAVSIVEMVELWFNVVRLFSKLLEMYDLAVKIWTQTEQVRVQFI